MFVKYRSLGGTNWVVYHRNMSATPQNGYLNLNTTSAFATSTDPWNNTAPTSSVITMGAGAGSAASTNYSVQTSVIYCFAPIAGYSAFGSYTGNGSADGPFVFIGFRPRFVMFKRIDATEGWYMYDTARTTINVMGAELRADSAAAESDFSSRDFLSNGFKIRTANGSVNASGGTYIYMAFAESPFKYANAR
jgi:hypothetical protein